MDDELCVTVVSKYKKLLHFDVLNLGQILCVDKTGFPQVRSHIHQTM